ncbi:alpha/beta hydrolase [Saccharothrix australiensis]|uniref:alpha/beta hydrolase n=1 Tax=Saccharothrix australiensis TaxID=2072 RepID=UPI001B87EC98|nr:alpha/beta hydrolase [Saccharothrix australiensis]
MRLGLGDLIDAGLVAHVAECRAANAASRAVEGPSDPDELRAARAKRSAVPPDPAAVEQVVEAAGRQVPVRVLLPAGDTAPRGVHLDIHGGGFYLGSAAQGDARNRRLADALGVAVVSVDYRLAPEHPWPAAPDDCETAALWLLERAEARFGTTRLSIGGFSAGATLAMTTLLRLRDRGVVDPFAGAALQFGTYDLSGLTPAGRLIADEYFIQAYAGHVPDRTAPDISPVYGDLRGLPPVLVVVGSLDVLLEDNLAMTARLSAAGGEVDLRIYPEAPHGFTSRPTGMADAALHDIERWLAGRLSPTSG